MSDTDKYEFLHVEAEPFSAPRGIRFRWECKKVGFGEVDLWREEEDGKWHCNTECMSQNFIEQLLIHWFKTVLLHHV